MDPDELLTVWARPLPVEQSSTRVLDGRSQTTRAETSYDRYGTPVTELDLGDPAVSTDDVTTLTTYPTCASSASAVLAAECTLSGTAAQRIAVRVRADLPDLGAGPRHPHRLG